MVQQISRSAQADRLRIAREAARILAEDGVCDYRVAKQKASERLTMSARGWHLPTNGEVEAALVDYHRLFRPQGHQDHIFELREAALNAMYLLEVFRPRLVGSVLTGLVGAGAPVQLHLFSDTAEWVAIHLMDRNIRYDIDEQRLKSRDGTITVFPRYGFLLHGAVIEATVMPPKAIRQAPASPIDGKPMRRARRADVEALLTCDESGYC